MTTWAGEESYWRSTGIWNPVTVNMSYLSREMLRWLEDNAGRRGHEWIFPSSGYMCFIKKEDAVAFEITWYESLKQQIVD